MGGSGMSLALMLHLCLARARQLKGVAKVGFVPALFNLNEPIMFGVPVVMNPLLAVPFVVAPLVCATTAWFAFHTNLVTRPHLDILWTLPAPIGAFGTTKDPGALVLMALNLGLAFLIYAPFVRAYDRRLLAQESGHGDAGGQSPQSPGARAGAPDERRLESPTSVQLVAHASTPDS
jgi:PTS system cellobiose-specific IIC component